MWGFSCSANVFGLILLVLVATEVATRRLQGNPGWGCGVPDARAATHGDFGRAMANPEWNHGWDKKALTYKVLNYPTKPKSELNPENFDDSIAWAFRTWTWSIDLTARKVTHGDADINISFNYMDGVGHHVGNTFPPPNGTLIFDIEEPWWTAFRRKHINFHWVSLHEIGHVLGMDHSPSETSAMYKDYSESHPTPSSEDWRTVESLYPVKPNFYR